MDVENRTNESGIDEFDRQFGLLEWTTGRLDTLPDANVRRELMQDMLDWLAHYTREYFGFQERLMREFWNPEAFSARMNAHVMFRRKLSSLCLDMMRGDPTVAERMRALCHEMLEDAQVHDQPFVAFLRETQAPVRLRRKSRHNDPAKAAAQIFPAWQERSAA